MTVEEYRQYSDIAVRLFNYMNGKINTMNNQCTLQIEMFDLIYGTYGNIRYPNHVCIYVGTIIDSWDPDWSRYMNKHDYIGTCIAWAISHELHHADQLISMIQYNKNTSYKEKVEGDVELASYNWVGFHAKELSAVGGFNIVIYDIYSPTIPDVGNYNKAGVKEFYLQTICNILLRDMDAYNAIAPGLISDRTTDIVLSFNGIDKVVIKSNGIFLPENINQFSRLIYEWAGYYDRYSIACEMSTSPIPNDPNRRIAEVLFTISDRIINPMVFKS